MNGGQIKFRCSSLGHLMTEPKKKSELISETTKTHLVDVFVSAMYGRREEVSGKQLDKGNAREEDSITLVANNTKIFFKKNNAHLENEFIKGTPDIFTGETIEKSITVRDTKTSWSAHTFFRAKNSECPKLYYWQTLGYMALTGATKGYVDYCLVNGTPQAILDEKRKASYQYGVDFENDPAYVDRCKQIELNHIFDIESFRKENGWFDFHNDEWRDIPMKDRHFFFEIERNEDDIRSLYQRVIDSREWMNEFLFKTKKLQPI